MSKNIFKTPNSIENQLDKLKSQNTSALSNVFAPLLNLAKLFNILSRNSDSKNLSKSSLSLKESIAALFFKPDKEYAALKATKQSEEVIAQSESKPSDRAKFEILTRQKIIIGKFTKRVLEQTIKRNQIGRAI